MSAEVLEYFEIVYTMTTVKNDSFLQPSYADVFT